MVEVSVDLLGPFAVDVGGNEAELRHAAGDGGGGRGLEGLAAVGKGCVGGGGARCGLHLCRTCGRESLKIELGIKHETLGEETWY